MRLVSALGAVDSGRAVQAQGPFSRAENRSTGRDAVLESFSRIDCGMIVGCLWDPSPDMVAVSKRIRRRMCAGSHKRSHRPATSWDVWAKIPRERKALWDVETAPTGAQTQFFDSPVGGALKAPAPPKHNRVGLS